MKLTGVLAFLVAALPSVALADVAPPQIVFVEAKPEPIVDVGAPEVADGLAVAQVRQVAFRFQGQLKRCYTQRLKAKSELEGRVVLTFDVLATGKVAAATVGETTVKDTRLENCMAAVAGRWVFPKPEGGRIVRVTMPVTLYVD